MNLFLEKPSNATGRTRMARAIQALKVMQLSVTVVTGSARMVRALPGTVLIFECHNGLSHSGSES